MLGQGTLSAYMQHRAFRSECRGHAGDGIGAPGARGGHHAAQPAGLAGIAVRGVGGSLFVPHIDDADALIQATVVDVDDVPAAEGEYGIHPFVFQGSCHQMATGYDILRPAFLNQGIGSGV